jgi:hypothetical protein
MDHDQRVIIKFLWNDGAGASQIVARLQKQFVEHAYQLCAVKFWITEIWRDPRDLHDEIRSVRSPLDDLDGKILAILDKSPFESAHSIAKRLLVARSTVLQHLHESLGFRSFHLHWVPHILTDNLRDKRKEYATTMLPFLHAAECHGWHHLMTGDESGFFFDTSRRRIWASREMMWSQRRDMIFKAKKCVCDHMESEGLLCCRQTPK